VILFGQNVLDNGLIIVCSPDGQNFVLPAVHNFGAYKYFFTMKVCRILLPILAVFICFHNGISKNNQKVNVLLLLW
jgi:uncharacterized membrane protein YqaE (UPF0057 family)